MKNIVLLMLLLALEISAVLRCNLNGQSQIIQEVLQLNRKMETEFNAGNYSSIGTFYADEAVMIGNTVEINGQSNLISYWGQLENAHQWKLENIDITILGKNAVLQRGYSNISYYQNDQLKTSRSVFSLIWTNTDQGWKILLDHFSPR